MTQLQQNIKAIEIAVDNARYQAIEGRNNILRGYWKSLPREVRDSLTYSHGTRVYRDKKFEQFLNLINKQPISWRVEYTGGDDNELLAGVINDVYADVFVRSLVFKEPTGNWRNNLKMFVHEVGTPVRSEVRSVNPKLLPERAVASIVAMVDYASTLEYRGAAGGILWHVAQKYNKQYKGRVVIRYDYVNPERYGQAGWAAPRIQIGFKGNVREKMQRPGIAARRTQGKVNRAHKEATFIGPTR